MKTSVRLYFLILFLLLGFCTGVSASGKLSVFVTIEPQKYFVQQIGKDLVDIQVMVPSGADAHTYEPKPKQMTALSGARLYFAIGIEFEEVYLGKIISNNPQLKVVHTDTGINKIQMKAHHHDEEEADEDHDHEVAEHAHHEHHGLDPLYLALAPLVKMQAETILNALNEADPVHKGIYEANYREFKQDRTTGCRIKNPV
jgi:zinc transport system substrate-binding protein